MQIRPIRQEGYELLHEGLLALTRIERNGIRIDVDRMQETKAWLKRKIRRLEVELEGTDVWAQWKKKFRGDANMDSHKQLAEVFHVDLEYEVKDTTESGEASTDEEALSKIDHPFIKPYVRCSKYKKALNTFLKGIEAEVINGRLHPTFLLHTVQTYRSSSTNPNFQNFPVRDKEISEIIRCHFIPSKDSVIVENDFKGIEVGVSACYHKDARFIEYITTPGKDMHRDMAAQIYMLEPGEVSKDARYGAKNKFVFPQFYGDYYLACAKNLWEWIDKGKLTGPGGIHMLHHLKTKGIRKLGACDPDADPEEGTFEWHLREVENDFWNNRFQAYGQWRKDWYREYLKKGYFDTLTGFRIGGYMRRNAVVNYPVQGSAFHCLLWSLIQIDKTLRKYKMKSMVVGQIHDSLIGDVRTKELKDYLEIVEEVTTVKLRKRYPWLIVPLEIEYEIAPSNGTWFDKQEVKFKQGRFYHPEYKDKFTEDPLKFVRFLDSRNPNPRPIYGEN